MYRSKSVLFLSNVVIVTNVATALIQSICTMQLSFRLDKRPGESHLALDEKTVPACAGAMGLVGCMSLRTDNQGCLCKTKEFEHKNGSGMYSVVSELAQFVGIRSVTLPRC